MVLSPIISRERVSIGKVECFDNILEIFIHTSDVGLFLFNKIYPVTINDNIGDELDSQSQDYLLFSIVKVLLQIPLTIL